MLYHVFAGSNWYPNGGVQDFQGAFATIAEARAFARGLLTADTFNDWAHIAWYDDEARTWRVEMMPGGDHVSG